MKLQNGSRPTKSPRLRASAVPTPQSFVGDAFEVARRSGFRGMFFFPGLEPSAQLPAWTRETIAEKINWLYNNVPAVRMAIDGLSLDEVDTGIWPKATARNAPAFNNANTDRFHETWKDPRFFDSRAVVNVYSAQWLVRRHCYLHGELFGQMLRPGPGSPYARIHFIPSWQVRWPSKAGQVPDDWEDGVHLDSLGAPLEYRVITKRDESAWVDVPAGDMLHFHDQFWVGQKRGISCLAPVARKLFTLDDIEKALANGIQLRQLIAYAIERKEGDTGGPTLFPNAVETEEIEADPSGDGAKAAKVLVQKIVSPNGNETVIAEPPAGRTIKVLESNQHSEPMSFKTDVLRDVALCTLYPPEYVFSLAGLTQGTLVRLTMRRVQIVKNTIRQFQLIPQFMEPLHRFRTWQDIKRGLYDRVQGGVPEDWWRVKMICPADTTVDIGREGRLFDERVATGKMSPEAYHGIGGDDASDVEDEVIATRLRREAKLTELNATREDGAKLKYEDLWPANTTAATALITSGNTAPLPDDD